MNILLINHYAGSPTMGMEYRPYYLSKEWLNAGHSVTIIAANNSHIRKINHEMDTNFNEENIDGITYFWIKTKKYSGNGISRMKNIFDFVRQVNKKANYIANKYKPDVVIASSTYPSDNYPARKIARRANAKYLYEVHDLWPLSPMELGGMSKYHPFIMLMQHGENFAYKNVDAVISMLPKTQEHMKEHGLDLKKWYYIPNGIVINKNKTKQLSKELKSKIYTFKAKTLIGYAGGHAISNSLETIINAAHLLSSNSNIHFILVGDGAEKKQLINKAKNLKNISFFNTIPKNKIQQFLKLMDFLIITWNKSSLYRFGISPNKIFDYMLASKPIIHAVNAPNKFVDEAKCGIAIEPENPQAIVDAILKLQKMTKKQLETMGKNGQKYVLKNHDYKILSEKFIEIIENL